MLMEKRKQIATFADNLVVGGIMIIGGITSDVISVTRWYVGFLVTFFVVVLVCAAHKKLYQRRKKEKKK